MPYILVRNELKDYDKWKRSFHGYADKRKANGSKGALILLDTDEPNVVMILFESDDLERGQKYFESQALRARLKEAGVQSKPHVNFIDEMERTSE